MNQQANPAGFFYEDRHRITEQSANAVLSVLKKYLKPTSVIDLGCGVGTWLSASKKHFNCDRVLGIDGPWVDKSLLKIDQEDFKEIDLTTIGEDETKKLGKWSLAICLEVAEHLPPTSASSLTLALGQLSDVVLFSAAIPQQGGNGHLNEQWPGYWASNFHSHGYLCIDLIRPNVWDDTQVLTHYKQNCLLFIEEHQFQLIKQLSEDGYVPVKPKSLVHPQYWTQRTVVRKLYFREACRQCWHAGIDAARRRLGFSIER